MLLTVSAIYVQSLVDGTSATRGTMVIHGGTGRFAEATGEALVNRNADEEAVSFEGWINYH